MERFEYWVAFFASNRSSSRMLHLLRYAPTNNSTKHCNTNGRTSSYNTDTSASLMWNYCYLIHQLPPHSSSLTTLYNNINSPTTASHPISHYSTTSSLFYHRTSTPASTRSSTYLTTTNSPNKHSISPSYGPNQHISISSLLRSTLSASILSGSSSLTSISKRSLASRRFVKPTENPNQGYEQMVSQVLKVTPFASTETSYSSALDEAHFKMLKSKKNPNALTKEYVIYETPWKTLPRLLVWFSLIQFPLL